MRQLLVLIVVLAAIAALGAQGCAAVFPIVELTSFDAATGTYTYTITCPSNSTYQFGYIQIDTQLPNVVSTADWSTVGAVVGGVDTKWPQGFFEWDVVNSKWSAFWDPVGRGNVVPALTYWQGVLKLIVPHSQPVLGVAATKDGQVGSYHANSILVPGPDVTAPSTTIIENGTKGNNDWYVTPVDVTLSATDPDDPVAGTKFSLDGADWVDYAGLFSVTDDGAHLLAAVSTDGAGNIENPPAQVTFNIDQTGPSVTGAAATDPNSNGWYKSSVGINYTAVDQMSGLAAPSAADPGVSIGFTQTVDTEGASLSDTGSATDNAGNVGSFTVNGLKIDKTPPVVDGSAAGEPNADGWYAADVTVNYTATDALSGLDGPSAADPGTQISFSHTVSTEGAGLSDTGSATDKAGNDASFVVSGLKIDKSAPVVNGVAATPANTNGWYNTDVVINYTATDAISGLASPSAAGPGEAISFSHTVSGEGEGLSDSATATDKAGNNGSSTVSGLKIDKTAPVVTIAAPADGQICGPSVAVGFSATDALSGIDTITGDVDGAPVSSGGAISLTGGTHVLTVTATDKAGNSATKTVSFTVDADAPTIAITAPVAGQTYGASVTPQFTASDTGSGIDTVSGSIDGAVVTSGTPVTLASGSHTLTVTATDKAGNSATKTVSFTVDADAPFISIAAFGSGPICGPTVTPQFSAIDTGSGIDTVSGDIDGTAVTSGQSITLGTGSHALTVVATDKAGNKATQKATFTVDATPPVVTIQSPVADAVFNDTRCPVPVAFTVTDNMDAHPKTSVFLDGQPFTGTSLVVANLTFGDHTLSVTATDAVGNSATASADFKVVAEALKLFDVDHVDIDWADFKCSKKASKIDVSGELDLPCKYSPDQLTGEVIILIEIGGREGTDTVLTGYKGRCGLHWNYNEQRYETPSGLNLDIRRAVVQWSRSPLKPDKFSFVGSLDHGVFNDETGVITVTLTLPLKSGGNLSGTELVHCGVKRNYDWHYCSP